MLILNSKVLESLFIGISIAAIPGPIFFELVRRTLIGGFKSGALLVIGEFTGNMVLLVFIYSGVSIFLTSNITKAILFIIGGIVLVKIGVSALKLNRRAIESYEDKIDHRGSFVTGLLIAVTSPIVIALWISLSGSYLTYFNQKLVAFLHIFLIAFGFLVFFLPLAFVVVKTHSKIAPKYIVMLSKIFGIILLAYASILFYYAIKQ